VCTIMDIKERARQSSYVSPWSSFDTTDPGLIPILLGRPECCEPDAQCKSIEGRSVLITGAGGSIGTELAIAVAKSAPALLVVVDNAEANLFRLEAKLSALSLAVPVRSVLADVSRESDVRDIFRQYSVDLVYHAAAYKHVHFAERYWIPFFRTNVLGTKHVISAAAEAGATFILISTDKAQQPVGLLGVSKGLAELITSAYSGTGARSFTVRSGNVIGSSGSFLELIGHSLRNGQPIPVTCMEASRYYLTAREVANLLLRANRVGRAGSTYWLNLGPEFSVRELLGRLNSWLEMRGYPRTELNIIGLRPGERLREPIVLASQEAVAPGVWQLDHVTATEAEASSLVRRLSDACEYQNKQLAIRIARESLGVWGQCSGVS
jgi:FlaA1/EpsC-like NDP-sugar epimerase